MSDDLNHRTQNCDERVKVKNFTLWVLVVASLVFSPLKVHALTQCPDPGVCFVSQSAKDAWAAMMQCGFGDDSDGLGSDLTPDGPDGPGNGGPAECSSPVEPGSSDVGMSPVNGGGSGLFDGLGQFTPQQDSWLTELGAANATDILGTHVGNPIQVVTGNKYQRENDISLPGGFDWVRHYNSDSEFRGSLGRNWRHGFDVRLLDKGDRLYLWQADGRRLDFQLQEVGDNGARQFYAAQYGDGFLVAEQNQYHWFLNDGQEFLLTGERGGRLHKVSAPDGRQLTLSYNNEGLLSGLMERNPKESKGEKSSREKYKNKSYNSGSGLQSYEDSDAWEIARKMKLSYNKNGLLTEVTVEGWEEFGKENNESSFENVRYGYDGNKRLAWVEYADGMRRYYHYENEDYATHLTGISVSSPSRSKDSEDKIKKRISTWRYDKKGRAVASIRHEGGDLNVTLDYQSGKTVVTDSSGNVSTYLTSKAGGIPHVVKILGPGCSACGTGDVDFSYNDRFQPEKSDVARKGKLVANDWQTDLANEAGLPVRLVRSSVNPDDKYVTLVEYNESGKPITVTERGWAPTIQGSPTKKYRPIERQTRYTWNNGRLVEIDGPLPNGANGDSSDSDITRYRYTLQGWLKEIHYPLGETETFEYDTLGRIIRHRHRDGTVARLNYDPRGRLSRLARAGRKLFLSYDSQGRINAMKNNLGQRFELEHNGSDQLVAIIDQEGQRINWEYDAKGKLLQRQLLGPDGSLVQEKHLNTISELAGTTLQAAMISPEVGGNHQQRRIAVDSQGRLTWYHYDDFGRLVSERSPVTGTTYYEYDKADRLTAVRYVDGSEIKLNRDVAGRLVRRLSQAESVELSWNTQGQLSHISQKESDGDRYEERFIYNENARLIEHRRDFNGEVFTTGYSYDGHGRLKQKQLPGGEVLRYRYNPADHPKAGALAAVEKKGLLGYQSLLTGINSAGETLKKRGFTYFNGLQHYRTLNLQGKLTSAGSMAVAYSELYWLEGSEHKGEKQSKDKPASSVGSHKAYGGTKSDRVLPPRVAQTKINSGVPPTVDYHYPRAMSLPEERGLWRKTLEAVQLAPAPKHLDSSKSAGSPVNWHSARYNRRGQLSEDSQRRYEWDLHGRLVAIFSKQEGRDDRLLASYRYNVFGERIAKTVYPGSASSPSSSQENPNGATGESEKVTTRFLYDGSNLVAEVGTRGDITRQYLHLDERPVMLLQDGEHYAIHTDHRHAPLAVTDKKQRVVWQAEVADNGAASLSSSVWLDLPLRGSNQYFDAETGLHYNTHRYLDPNRGRYLSPDPLGLDVGPDLYLFALGQPHQFIDSQGLAPQSSQGGESFNQAIHSSVPMKPFSKPLSNTPLNNQWDNPFSDGGSDDIVLSAAGEIMLENSMHHAESGLIKQIFRIYEYCEKDIGSSERHWTNAVDQIQHDINLSIAKTLDTFLLTFELANSKTLSWATILTNPAGGSVKKVLEDMLKNEVQSALLSPGMGAILTTMATTTNVSVGGEQIATMRIDDEGLSKLSDEDLKALIKDAARIYYEQAEDLRDKSYLSGSDIAQNIEIQREQAKLQAEIQLQELYEEEIESYLAEFEKAVFLAKQKADLARESSEEAELNWKRYWEDVADGIREENPELEGELKEESKIKTDIYRDAEEALVVVEKILKNARDEIGEYENGLYGIPLDEQQRIRNRMYDSLKNAADMAEHGSVRG
ncbi:DUF6531 domain-containing protein [Alcanivorax sp.]|uniref:DUF6531 domain-containing protein n=1 Tax=Alcanivorax sp. TaxID=1872427 RepID=UPI0025C6A454|nr:DUF6531 domain-containing protein [Alcanivorax sp.]